ncbi:glucose-6-phosphate isomerase [Cutibacterium acnes JCM 18909]|nr:glucose-6-phosphate isomerase [Cutibacterium acnes JCM 18909]
MANPAHPTKDGATDVHELFLSNFFAQTAALPSVRPPTRCAPRALTRPLFPLGFFCRRPSDDVNHGSRTIPKVLGELIALYEHITFCAGCRLGYRLF